MIRRLFMIVVLSLIATGATKAETVQATVPLSPSNEIPPVTGLNATGGFQITVDVTRDTQGAITGGAIRFLGSISFPSAVTVVGLHIHEGPVTGSGDIRFNSGISTSAPREFPTGKGLIDIIVTSNINVDALKRLIANPAGFYVNLHTTVNTDGAMRGQIVRLVETVASTVTLSTMAARLSRRLSSARRDRWLRSIKSMCPYRNPWPVVVRSI